MWDYRGWLAEHIGTIPVANAIVESGFRNLDEEIRSLPGAYSPPEGRLFIALNGKTPVGCAALHRLRPDVGEIKRVYVRPEGRGQGIGRRLTRAALDEAKRLGYHRVVLDTLPSMGSAVALYRKMGFRPIPAYWKHPVPGALFFEYALE
jgi:GNAT superfamily N-acetyltransferase